MSRADPVSPSKELVKLLDPSSVPTKVKTAYGQWLK